MVFYRRGVGVESRGTVPGGGPNARFPGYDVLETIDTWDDTIDEVEDLTRKVDIGRPHWCQLGDALVFTQAIAGLELG